VLIRVLVPTHCVIAGRTKRNQIYSLIVAQLAAKLFGEVVCWGLSRKIGIAGAT
jgi:hypothetical protein